MVQQLTEQRPCHEYTDIAAAATRTGARRADAMYQCRKAYLEHVEDMDTSNAQKQFEQLRSAKEVFSKQFQSISDDVVGFVHEMDIRTLVDECRTPQETPQKPPSAEKFAFQGTAVGDFAYDLSTRSTSRTEWVEPLALVHAKGCIDDADVEFAQAAKGLRLIDDDLKRTDNVFITAIEIDVQLAAWVSRLRETTRMRSDIAPLLLQHAIGAKSVLGRRMQDRRELRTATDVAEINRVVPELVGRLDARRGADDAAVERLEPDMEDLLSVQAQLGHWNQSTQQHRDRTVLSLNVQVTGLDVEMAAASARLVWLSDQLLCVEEDALGRIRQSSDVAVATGSLQPHRAGLAYLYDIGVLYPFVNAQWYATLQASMVQEAEIAFIKQLIALELTQATTVLACISTWQATVADMLKAYLRSPSTDAATLYRIALSSVMTFVPSAAPCNFDGDWLQRAVHDMQLHEKYCLDQMQDGFVQAKDLHSSVVALAHKAWVNQCLAVLNATSAGLRAAVHALDETSGPRQDAERSFRSAKEDLASCRHKLRCCFEAHRRSHDMQLAIRDSMLHLRQILTTHTKVESVARLASLKTTKYLWDQLATYQSESFASVFEDASELESQMEQMSREQELLTVQVERAEGLVGAKEAAWKAAVWVHMGASVRVQRWQSSLHAVLHLVLDLETKRQRALELDLHLHAGVADDLHQNGGTIPAPIIADVLVVDSTLIESSMLRLELQKQTRLTQRSANRVRVLERMCRQETELLQSYPPSDIPVANAFRTLHEHMHTASDASWRRCHAQAAAFAEENWLVQHRKNVVLAVQSLLTAAIDAHDGNKATLDDLVRTQLAMVDGIGSNPEQLAPKRPMDAMHLMLFLNASASATWARQVNLKRTVLQEAMYIKRTDKLEWFKVDPNCPEYVANADSVINHSAVHSFGSVNPAPALFDIPLMQLWGAFDSITIHKRVELERQLRHLALSVDLRAADVDVHEAILGGDLKSKDVAEVYGRPKRLAGGQFASLMASFVSAVRTAKFIRRLIAHKHAIQQKNQIFAAATDRLRDVQLLAALVAIPCKLLTHATVMTVIGPFLRDSLFRGIRL
ncbi:hypothetical protein B5M09_000947 [Aphanomyces astaci]|uniref:Uncharacterized protein n=1 Tax=Aphanomyces astaci TaxID=112090 RepID=A0A3R7ZKU1_APHAT|nr:hypothetical protein B5M09_000947 [Aphanomyces astaci]